MELFKSIIEVFGLGLLGIVLYAVVTVWKKIREDGFKWQKFVNDNKKFWIVGCLLQLLISFVAALVPDIVDLLHALGFAIEEDTYTGWILLGVFVGAGGDKTKISGIKNLVDKK